MSATQTRPPLLRGQTMPARLPSLDDAVAAYSFTQGSFVRSFILHHIYLPHSPSRFWLPYHDHRCAHPQSSTCDRTSERASEPLFPAFHFLIMPSHLPLIPTHLPPGSRDAIRRVLAAEEAHAQSTPLPPTHNQPSSSSPTVCTRFLYSVCYRPFVRSPRIALATGAFTSS